MRDLETEFEQESREFMEDIKRQMNRLEDKADRTDLRVSLMADSVSSALKGVLDDEELQVTRDILDGKYEAKEIE